MPKAQYRAACMKVVPGGQNAVGWSAVQPKVPCSTKVRAKVS